MAQIKLEGIYKAYDKHKVHNNLNLTIKDGECFTLLGPSGCGKSVLMRMIAGFELPDKGKIYIGDTLVADGEARALITPDRRDLGVVFQEYAVWPHMTVFDNIAYPLKIKNMSNEEIHEKVMHIVDIVNLIGLEQRMPSQLSGGQQQRVALGRALVGNPSLMLLDEPLNNLDANLREEMRFEIKDLQRKLGITIFYVTHDQEIALAISDRIAIMDKIGNIVQIGEPAEVFEHPVNDYVFRFLGVSSFLPVKHVNNEYFSGENKAFINYVNEAFSDDLYAAFRPTDVKLSRDGEGTPGVVLRSSFLGADMDFLIKIGDETIRAQMNTHEAIEQNLLLKDGDKCVVNFLGVNLYNAATPLK